MIQRKYAQLKTLSIIFDVSENYFKKRMHKEFKQGVHFLIPKSSSRTKKIVLWDIKEVDKWIKSSDSNAKDLVLDAIYS